MDPPGGRNVETDLPKANVVAGTTWKIDSHVSKWLMEGEK